MLLGALNGAAVLVTRPESQGRSLCALIEAAGGEALHFPVIEIAPLPDESSAKAQFEALSGYCWVIFVSANAVRYGCQRIHGCGQSLAGVHVAAIGESTARALKEQGRMPDCVPVGGRFDSEALLAQPALRQLAGRRVLIVRGVGGREELAAELRKRGALVEYAEVYRRVQPPAGRLEALLEQRGERQIHAVVVTSNEGLTNLYSLAGEARRDWLRQRQLVVMGRRAAELARTLGFVAPAVVVREMSDQGYVDALIDWWKGRQV